MIPNGLAECFLGDVQQHVTRFIYSQSWEMENIESLRWMLAVESVVGELFPAIPSATSETTTSQTPSTCAVSYSLAPFCFPDVLPIEAAPLPSTMISCSAMPSDCSAADVVPDPNFSCVSAPSDPGAFRAAERLCLEGELTSRTRTCRPTRRKVRHRCNLRSGVPFARLASLRRHQLCPRLRTPPRVCPSSRGFLLSRPNPRSVVPRLVRLVHDLRSRPRCKMRR